jgi:hypothetical protein
LPNKFNRLKDCPAAAAMRDSKSAAGCGALLPVTSRLWQGCRAPVLTAPPLRCRCRAAPQADECVARCALRSASSCLFQASPAIAFDKFPSSAQRHVHGPRCTGLACPPWSGMQCSRTAKAGQRRQRPNARDLSSKDEDSDAFGDPS